MLFTGHMVDAPGRASPRFPAARSPQAARRIAAALDEIGAGPADLALDAGRGRRRPAVRRGVPARARCRCACCCRLHESEFVAAVAAAGRATAPHGTRAFAPSSPASTQPPREAPRVLGPLAAGEDAFVRGNLLAARERARLRCRAAALHLPVGRRRRRRAGRHAPSGRCRVRGGASCIGALTRSDPTSALAAGELDADGTQPLPRPARHR